VDAELRKQPTADKGADNTDNDVTDNPKTSALHNLPGQPSSQEAHQQYDQQTLGGQVHRRILQISANLYTNAAWPTYNQKRSSL